MLTPDQDAHVARPLLPPDFAHTPFTLAAGEEDGPFAVILNRPRILELLERSMEFQDNVLRFTVSGPGMVQGHQPDRFIGVGVVFRWV